VCSTLAGISPRLFLEEVMDLATKVFLVNLLLIFVVAGIDRVAFKGTLEYLPGFSLLLNGWIMATIVSIPVLAGYLLIQVLP